MAQVEVTEYMVLLFFIGAILVFFILFLGGMQANQLEMEKEKLDALRDLTLLRRTADSRLFSDGDGTLLHAKLLPLLAMCGSLQATFGPGWHAEVIVFDGNKITDCAKTPSCNRYVFCGQNSGTGSNLELPVSLARPDASNALRTFPAVLRVGVYD
ncbi:MAG: hypothetical protein HY519_04450 [Candidatus Aenigmarchaeota archaeon]|nr:hypothetical protein [Candidatus Aenigmarchaeota archaeon]